MERSEIRQGSIELNEFDSIVRHLKTHYCLNDAQDWMAKAKKGALRDKDICLTFDDNIKSQITVAQKVLDNHNIKAFFFLYTSMYSGEFPRLEIYRYFRAKYFQTFDEFFRKFIDSFDQYEDFSFNRVLDRFPESYLQQFSFYSRNERIFRYIRDEVLHEEKYNEVMDAIIEEVTTVSELSRNIWMSEYDIKKLSDESHELGLHSLTHPYNLGEMPDSIQKKEYEGNKTYLEAITHKSIESVSYPSGSYNSYTIKLMEDLGLVVGFRADMQIPSNSSLELPRRDCAYLLNDLQPKRSRDA